METSVSGERPLSLVFNFQIMLTSRMIFLITFPVEFLSFEKKQQQLVGSVFDWFYRLLIAPVQCNLRALFDHMFSDFLLFLVSCFPYLIKRTSSSTSQVLF